MSAPQQSSDRPTLEIERDDTVSPAPGAAAETASTTSAPTTIPSFVSASESALFGAPEEERCDVCGEPMGAAEMEDAEQGYAVAGRGLLVWSETRREEPLLCPACATAVGVSALARWEIEEEEG